MKNHSAYRRLRETKGFTLMEILVVMVIIVVLAFNFLGDGLRDAADPYH